MSAGLNITIQLTLDLAPHAMPGRAPALAAASRAGDAAIERGAMKARSIDPAFIDRASEHMLLYLHQHGTSSGELMTDACKLAGIRSTDDRHFGVVFRALIRGGLIRWAGECKRTKGHASRGGSLYQEVIR